MAEALLIAGQLIPAAAGWETLYEVPALKCFTGSLTPCNFDAAADAYRIAVAVAGAADADAQAVAYGVPIPGTGTPGHSGRAVKPRGITAGPGDLIRVWADVGTIAFSLSGVLRDALAVDAPDYRVLNQVALAGAGLEDIYVAPDVAMLSGVVFCNRTSADKTIYLTRAIAGAADANAQRVLWAETLFANDVFVWGKGETMAATDVLRANANAAGVSVGVYGWGVAAGSGGGGGAPWTYYGPPLGLYFT